MPVSLSREGNVSILMLGNGENRFTDAWLDDVEDALEEAIASAPAALVTTGDGKMYSNGLDTGLLTSHHESVTAYLARVERLFARVLTAPVPTIAAINGHAFGAGAILAFAHDFRVMNAERGFFCLPESDLGIPFPPGMAALIQAKLTPAAAIEAMTTGKRYGGTEAQHRGLVDRAVSPDALRSVATEKGESLSGKDATTLGAIKAVMFAAEYRALGGR